MIPTQPTPSWFKSLDSINKFYWKNKTPRIKLTTLQKQKKQGGLAAPHFPYYYLANQLQYIFKWIHPKQSDSTWLGIEETICKNISISDLPFLTQTIKRHLCFKTLSISATLTAWWKYHKVTNSTLAPSKFTPVWNNPDLLSNKNPLHFRTWVQRGNTQLQHIYQNNTLVSFVYLVREYGIGSNQFLEYLQLKSSIQATYSITAANLELPQSASGIINIRSTKKILSRIYTTITQSDKSISIPITKWEEDLLVAPDADSWTQICQNIYRMTKNTNLQLIQYKILHRTHLTGHKMFKMGFTSDTCTNCSQNKPDTYIHAIWHCTPIQRFWTDVTTSLSALMGCHIPLSPPLLSTQRYINTRHAQIKPQTFAHCPNYRQESNPHEQEIQKQHKYHTMEKFTQRIHQWKTSPLLLKTQQWIPSLSVHPSFTSSKHELFTESP